MTTVSVRYIVDSVEDAMPSTGISLQGRCRRTGGRQILVEDPSGNPVELFQSSGA